MSSSRQDRIKSLEEKKKQIEAKIQKLKAIESAKKRMLILGGKFF